MTFSFIGGGAWGSTLAQVLLDNHHQVMIYEKNEVHRQKLKKHEHPLFHVTLPTGIEVTDSLDVALAFSNYIIVAIPTKFVLDVLKSLQNYDLKEKVFVNVSKGFIMPELLTISQAFDYYLKDNMKAFVSLSGPSHAEEVIERNVTTLVSASKNAHEKEVIANAFNNNYMRIYLSDDPIGCEVGGATKNAIAVSSGILTALEFGENARAALLTRGLMEIKNVILFFGGKQETAYGLTGLGDLMVTAQSMNSRNFKAGLKIGQGMKKEDIELREKQTIEGFNTIYALYHLAQDKGLKLPIIESSYYLIFKDYPVDSMIKSILNHGIKDEYHR